MIARLREGLSRVVTFLSEVQAELAKVHWPSRRETYAATVVVITISLIMAIYLGAVDLAISALIQAVLQ
ncbi:MAG: protein translocase subunit SecE [Candidatus Binatia bacterium]|nr:MAG: protein translocase subunit SecE [Candidatus Binatia bacterium]